MMGMKPLNKVGIYVNPHKKQGAEMASVCIEYFKKHDIQTVMLQHQLRNFGLEGAEACGEIEFYTMTDCIVTLGGDGTILGVARNAAPAQVPICGINLGKLGFLTEGEAEDLEKSLAELVENRCVIDERMMLKCTVTGEDGTKRSVTGLNDILIRSTGMRMLELTAAADDEIIDNFRADGLIISTPTGSTGYSLSAGGPVVSPATEVILLNPICPHRMHDRTYVVSPGSIIKIKLPAEERDVIVYADGQIALPVSGRDRIQIEKASYSARLVRPKGFSFFKRLRNKFNCD